MGRSRKSVSNPPDTDAGAPGPADFAGAVREALRNFHRPDLLRTSPLLNSRLVAAARGADAAPAVATETLRGVLRSHHERLGEAPEVAVLKRVLELTYLKPLRSQQAVADALSMSWSTYRRRLTTAVGVLSAQLWEAESALRASGDHAESVGAASNGAVGQPAPAVRSPARRRLVAAAVLALAATGAGFGAWRLLARSPSPAPGTHARTAAAGRPLTIAVLPFLNANEKPALQYLGDGVTDELINRLGRVPELRVAARTSAFVFRDKPVDVRSAARALGVEYVLEGSVQKAGGVLRVRVALVDAGDGYEVWSDEYNVAANDLLAAEDAITNSVIEELPLSGTPAAPAHMPSGVRSVAGEAHDLYMVGLEYLNRRTGPDIERAIGYFQRAVDAAPDYAPAWSEAATAYAVLRDYQSDAVPDGSYADALAAANRAVALDPGLDRPHAVLGVLHEEHWEWAQAEREFRLALRLDPNDVTAHQWYAIYLWFAGDMQGALREMRIAHGLDPLSPIVNADLGRALLYAGDTAGAVAQYRTAIALDPGFALAHLFLAEAYMAEGSDQAALEETRTAVQLTPKPHPASYLSMLGLAYVLTGHADKARAELAELEQRARYHYVSGVSLALLYWALDDKQKAFSSLERAAADHDHLMMPVVADRAADWATDPRYARVLASMHLPMRRPSPEARTQP